MGEGATSEGDFHEACNLAGVWKAAVVIFVQNNQWAISPPWNKQSASGTLAEKAFAYGFEGVRVDGNDLFAVYAAVSMAAARPARAAGRPSSRASRTAWAPTPRRTIRHAIERRRG